MHLSAMGPRARRFSNLSAVTGGTAELPARLHGLYDRGDSGAPTPPIRPPLQDARQIGGAFALLQWARRVAPEDLAFAPGGRLSSILAVRSGAKGARGR